MTRQLGIIDRYNHKKGYGFLKSLKEDSMRHFFHRSAFTEDSSNRLLSGEIVSFEIEIEDEESNRARAIALQPPKGFRFSFDRTTDIGSSRTISADHVPTTPLTPDRVLGVVSYWNREKKYGFVVPQSGPYEGVSVFVHHSAITCEGGRFLKPYEVVSFGLTICEDTGKVKCVDCSNSVTWLDCACLAYNKRKEKRRLQDDSEDVVTEDIVTEDVVTEDIVTEVLTEAVVAEAVVAEAVVAEAVVAEVLAEVVHDTVTEVTSNVTKNISDVSAVDDK
jgi:cold shock CspA family protein